MVSMWRWGTNLYEVARDASTAATLINMCWTCWHCVIAWIQPHKWQQALSTALATAALPIHFHVCLFVCVQKKKGNELEITVEAVSEISEIWAGGVRSSRQCLIFLEKKCNAININRISVILFFNV